jgi:hypothetical protein
VSDDAAFEERLRKSRKGRQEGNGAAPAITVEWFSDLELDMKQRGFVKGLLTEQTTAMAFGETGSAKTFLIADLGMHIALGWDWFGHKVTQGICIYIAAEAGMSLKRRVIAFRQHHQLDPQTRVPFGLISTPVNLLNPNMDLQTLIQAIKSAAAEFPDFSLLLIVIDTVSRALAGGNENAPEDMGTFLRNIDEIRLKTGAATLLVHHTGKTLSQGARGHSLLRAAMDTEIEIAKAEGARQGIARLTKQRDGDIGATYSFELKVVELGYDEDGNALTSCVVERCEGDSVKPKKAKAERKLEPDQLRALDFLSDEIADAGKPLSLAGYPSVQAVTLDQWRERLRQRGLYDGDGASRAWFYRMKKALIGAGAITIERNFVWIVPRR